MVNVYINYEKKFAFVEFRTGEQKSTCEVSNVLACGAESLSVLFSQH